MAHPLIEICVEGIDGFAAAQAGGADRVELCASLLEGGLTPSLGVIRQTLAVAMIPVHVIIRPRGGDFLYSELEFLTMLDDVRACRDLGVPGVVFGCLTADGRVDEVRMTELVEAARPMTVTCHRAFDMTRDPEEAIEALVRCGVDRVLTSGQHPTALAGIDVLKRTHDAAAGRIVIMACGGHIVAENALSMQTLVFNSKQLEIPEAVLPGFVRATSDTHLVVNQEVLQISEMNVVARISFIFCG